jgi:hypothetical protein
VKLYKFKDLADEQKHSHFLQMVLNNSIWCARPDSLNDEDEFKFELDYVPSPNTGNLLVQAVTKYRTTNCMPPNLSVALALENNTLINIATPIIEHLVNDCRNTIGITSFSVKKDDARLWKEYGGNGNGVRIEINIPDQLIGQSYHRVNYVQNKIFHVDSFLESVLFLDKTFETYRNILLTKTKSWSEEEEIRFISNTQNVNFIFDGFISEVTFGSHVPQHTLNKLMAEIANQSNSKNIVISKL